MNVASMGQHVSGRGYKCLSAGLVVFAVTLLTALACRYNVRDVGFVDLGSEDYRLICYVHHQMAKVDQDSVRNTCLAALLDTNIAPEIQAMDASSDQWLSMAKELGLGGNPDATLPTAVLTSPNGRRLSVPLKSGEALQDSLWDGLEALFDSPQRNEIVRRALSTYGVVVLLPGSDEVLNNQARAAATEAIEAVSERVVKNQLEKKIDQPPSLYELTGKLDRERALIWAMEMKPSLKEPQVAILYGRGRLIGSVLSGDKIIKENLLAVLGTIGLSCECGLDRSWMQGKMIPLRWDEKTYTQTAKSLGFDPENPEVKIEISQILQKGESRRGAQPREATSPSLDLLIPSYGETWINPNQAAHPAETEHPEQQSPQAAENQASVQATSPTINKDDSSTDYSSNVSSTITAVVVGLCVISIGGGLIFLRRSKRHA